MRICQGADLFEHFIYAVYVFRHKILRVLPVISFPEFIVGPEFARKQTALKRTVRKDTQTLVRSEEHTSELQSRENLVCRLLLEKKKKNNVSARWPMNSSKKVKRYGSTIPRHWSENKHQRLSNNSFSRRIVSVEQGGQSTGATRT